MARKKWRSGTSHGKEEVVHLMARKKWRSGTSHDRKKWRSDTSHGKEEVEKWYIS